MRKPHLLRSFEIYGRHSGHVRTVPVPDWVKARVDDWMKASGTASGCLFRSINERGIVWGNGLTEKVVWYVVKNFAKTVGIEKVAPHDLRRYAPGSVTLQVESSN